MSREFSKEELGTLNNALNEILNGPNAIDGDEFHTRMGTERGEAVLLLEKIGKLLDQ